MSTPQTGDIITVDELPSDFSDGDPITVITDDQVVVRSPSMLWVAQRLPTPTILDAEFVE